jgi:hypothetical protein
VLYYLPGFATLKADAGFTEYQRISPDLWMRPRLLFRLQNKPESLSPRAVEPAHSQHTLNPFLSEESQSSQIGISACCFVTIS